MGGDLTLYLAVALGLYMAFSIGANDVANAMGTSVGSKALTIKQAILIAGVLEFLGAFLVGGQVTKTVRGGILDPQISAAAPELIVYGMLAALMAAGTWLVVASRLGWPVSTTHSIVGAIAGFGIVAFGFNVVQWEQLTQIVASWVVSPLLCGVLAYLIFSAIKWTILRHPDPVRRTRKWAPLYIFSVVIVISLVTLFKGLQNIDLDLTLAESLLWSGILGIFAVIAGHFLLGMIGNRSSTETVDASSGSGQMAVVEKMFGVLQIMSACAVAFAHGSNDVANAIGPLAAVVNISQSGVVNPESPVPSWLLLVGGIGIVIGLATMGYRVMATIGTKITELTPTRGYSAEFAAAITIVLASRLGLPISTTQTLVGGVMGVGLAQGVKALDLSILGRIAASWIITVPVGALLAIVFFYVFRAIL
ncbi:MAG: inorganic phosphate transporter [Gemmatimonadetes bacterium]|nr:inorganic phosphate transporter [Gemmatimonadota bacterium]MYG85754.1 inorganic phosphate transporter [Gemmatimonadota bacterium]MYJ90090.1 inorganic phosphate transporter [Gemmatimonadota bacterium]